MENKENNQDNGLELLNKVIETNERNIEQGIKIEFLYEDLLFIKGETESTMRGLNTTNLKLVGLLEKETQEREKFLERIPKAIEAELSEDSLNFLKDFQKKSKGVKYLIFGSLGILLLSIIVIFSIGKLAKNWYSESIKTKTEIREELFTEIKNQGKNVYKTADFELLKHNTIIMNKWIQKNPKDSENFLRFKEGFESR
ncbi:hypothetical protein BAY13_10475 [Elizabethkingia bruuniana]|uniref:hypothetical protein n=1 Tax=Elizabethkingia bruuniana TaxID=1756149 RepID=UPI00099A10B7|nr:hypothetical protein [Elizabethkingia bruuniana]OPC59350.1 hypothetical protein BAY13_10475 [Elizabethkingia bruuniana]